MHIVVLGGGYSGVLAARVAPKRTNATVTLIDSSDRFIERLRLHQFASGSDCGTCRWRSCSEAPAWG